MASSMMTTLSAEPASKQELTAWTSITQLSGLIIVILLLICMKIGWLSIVSIYSLLRPQKTMKGSQVIGTRGIASFLIGLGVFVACVLIMALSKQFLGRRGIIISGPVILFLLYLLVSGGAVIYHFIGEKIQSNMNSSTIGSSFYAVIYGGILALLVDLIPVVGWIVSFIIVAESVGIAFLMLVRRKA